MRRFVVGAVVLVVVAAAAWWLLRRSDRTTAPNARTDRVASGATGEPAGPAPVDAGKFHRVTQLTPEQRRALAQAMEASRAHRAAAANAPSSAGLAGSGSAPALSNAPNAMETPEQVLAELQASFGDAKHYLADCVTKYAPKLSAFKGNLALSGDPDIGSLVDATEVSTPDGAPVPKAFSDCVRGELQTLALPPINNGDSFAVTYVFSFSDDGSGQ